MRYEVVFYALFGWAINTYVLRHLFCFKTFSFCVVHFCLKSCSWLSNQTYASRPPNFVNHSYDYRPNWTQLGPITITSRMEVSWSLAGLQVLEFLLILLLMFIVPVNLLSVKQRFPSLKISTIYGNFFYPLNSACLKKGENRREW